MYWSGHHGHDLIVDGFTNYLCSHEYWGSTDSLYSVCHVYRTTQIKGLISLLCQTLAVSHMLTLELLSQNLHEKWQSFSLYKSFNVCICFSIKLILLSLNNSQLCMVNSTVFKRQPLRNFFLKHKDILISNLGIASQLLQFIHIASCLIQPSLDEGHWII